MDCSVKKTLIGRALASELLPIASVDLDFMEEAHRMLLPSKMDLVAGARSRSSRRKPLTRLERPSPDCSRRLPLQRRVSRVTFSMRSSAWKHSDMGPMPRRWRSWTCFQKGEWIRGLNAQLDAVCAMHRIERSDGRSSYGPGMPSGVADLRRAGRPIASGIPRASLAD